MKKWKNNQGMTLVEIIVAITVLAVVTLPLFGVFLSSIKISTLKTNQMDINSVIVLIRKDVVNTVKAKDSFTSIQDNPDTSNKIWPYTKTITGIPDVQFKQYDNTVCSGYRYDIKQQVPDLSLPEDVRFTTEYPTTKKYIITIKKIEGANTTIITILNIKINDLGDVG